MNYKLSDIANITGGRFMGTDSTIASVATDSRSLGNTDGTMFIAIKGHNHDGHKYIKEMYGRGIRAFMVEQHGDIPDGTDGAGFVVTLNSVDALQCLAGYHRDKFGGTVIAVTGSNGKTVVKEWTAQMWDSSAGSIFRSPKSYNSQIGVPLSLLMLRGDERVAVIEAGISLRGEMQQLECIIRPDIGVITNIGDAHAENFTDQEEKLNEKLNLFTNCKHIIYPADDHLIDKMTRSRFAADRLSGWYNSDTDSLKIPFSDAASRQNASHVLAIYRMLGIDIADKLNNLQPVAMRLEMKEGILGSQIINDSYNSDIGSLGIALDYLNSVAAGRRRVVILSDILQSGLNGHELYSRVATMIASAGVECLVCVGADITSHSHLFGCRTLTFAYTDEAVQNIGRIEPSGSVILLKGSRPFRFENISRALEKKTHTTVLEVNLDAMSHNLNYYRGLLNPQTKIMVMVKALSYGSGSFEVASLFEHERVDYLAVAFADEGITLRQAGITVPIVVLNSDPGSFGAMIEHRLEPEIYSFSSLRAFADEVRHSGEQNYPIHIKIDTGMHRLGFMPNEIMRLTAILTAENAVKVASVFSHLAASDKAVHDDFTREQIACFDKASAEIVNALPDGRILRHICNSAAIERLPDAHYDMVRLGIGEYGISPENQNKLKYVSKLRSTIVQIKDIPVGDSIGYGRHGHADMPTRIAIIPIGYADGLNRRLGRGNASFMVGESLCPTIGNICMDTCMIDITGINAREGDDVIIFGEKPSITDLAEILGTIPYEILTSVSSRVKRIYIKE